MDSSSDSSLQLPPIRHQQQQQQQLWARFSTLWFSWADWWFVPQPADWAGGGGGQQQQWWR